MKESWTSHYRVSVLEKCLCLHPALLTTHSASQASIKTSTSHRPQVLNGFLRHLNPASNRSMTSSENMFHKEANPVLMSDDTFSLIV